MKISTAAYGFLLIISAFAAEKQLPENQKWDGKFFHKYTKKSLPLAKEVLNTYSLQDYSRVLDIGCGPGALTAYIARRINQQNGVVTGIDLNESMIAFATEHYARQENLLFFKLDLPIIQNVYDFIFYVSFAYD